MVCIAHCQDFPLLSEYIYRYAKYNSIIIYLQAETEELGEEILVKWLEDNDNPEVDVIQKWESTFTIRDRCKNVVEYFQKYKCLRSSFGHKLVKMYFALLVTIDFE